MQENHIVKSKHVYLIFNARDIIMHSAVMSSVDQGLMPAFVSYS